MMIQFKLLIFLTTPILGISQTGITTAPPKLLDKENNNNTVTNAIDPTNSTAGREDTTDSEYHSNTTINSTLSTSNTSHENESLSNVTYNEMNNETELKPVSVSNVTRDVISGNNTANNTGNVISNVTHTVPTVPPGASDINNTNGMATTHNDTHLTTVAPYANDATNSNIANNTISTTPAPQNVTDTINATKAVLDSTPGMSTDNNQSSNVLAATTERPSENITDSSSSNSVQNQTHTTAATSRVNTTTSAPILTKNRTINNQINTTASAANNTNGWTTENQSQGLLPPGTNEVTEQNNMTVQSPVNTTSKPLNTTENITEKPSVAPESNATGLHGLIQTTESPAANVSNTTTSKDNTTTPNKHEIVLKTTLAPAGTSVPGVNTTGVPKITDKVFKQNSTSTKAVSDGVNGR